MNENTPCGPRLGGEPAAGEELASRLAKKLSHTASS
jgi:hypothetical protein